MTRRFDHPPSTEEIEAIARTAMEMLPEPFEHLVRHILIHEVGHHFGLSDEDMHALEEQL